jgi:hypothetical protein
LAGNNSIIPLSPDLGPNDFHVSLHLKTFLGGQQFHDDDAKESVNTWFTSHAASFYNAGIQKLVPHYNKSLYNVGNYVKKKHKLCTSNGNINGLEINSRCFPIAHQNLLSVVSTYQFWL